MHVHDGGEAFDRAREEHARRKEGISLDDAGGEFKAEELRGIVAREAEGVDVDVLASLVAEPLLEDGERAVAEVGPHDNDRDDDPRFPRTEAFIAVSHNEAYDHEDENRNVRDGRHIGPESVIHEKYFSTTIVVLFKMDFSLLGLETCLDERILCELGIFFDETAGFGASGFDHFQILDGFHAEV